MTFIRQIHWGTDFSGRAYRIPSSEFPFIVLEKDKKGGVGEGRLGKNIGAFCAKKKKGGGGGSTCRTP